MNAQQFDPPLVAILRGLPPAAAAAVGSVLFEAGWRMLEVPLNRPGALASIAVLAGMAPPDAIVGGGTVLTLAELDAVHDAGGRLLVAPNMDVSVIARAVALGMLCVPGVATATEAFAALGAGAHALKLFPAEMVGCAGLKAIKSVLPAGTALWPVGGVTPGSIGAWHAAGATGFGIGSALYTPQLDPAQLGARARSFIAAWKAVHNQ